MDDEKRLEDILAENIGIASPNWMVIGRQVMTTYGNPIDLLAIDRDGNLVVIELKRDRTPRDVVAQLLDYASWEFGGHNTHLASQRVGFGAGRVRRYPGIGTVSPNSKLVQHSDLMSRDAPS